MSDAVAAPPTLRRPAVDAASRGRWLRVAVLVPLAGAAAYAVVLALRLGGIAAATLHNSDTLNSQLIADSLGRGAGTIWLPADTFVNAVWFDAATRWLPGHRELWAWWPTGLWLLGVTAVAASVRRIAGTPAGAIALVLGIAAPPVVLLNVIPENFHVTTLLNTALLGWFAVVACTGDLPERRLRWLAIGLGVLTGLDTASDLLLAVTGLAPLIGAVGLVRLREGEAGRRPLGAALVVLGATAAAMATTAALTSASGIAVLPAEGGGIHLATMNRVGINLALAGGGLSRIAVGPLLGRDLGATSLWALPAGLLLCAGLALAVGLGARALTVPAGRHPGGAGRRAHVAFWVLSSGLGLGAFLLTTIPAGDNAVRYLVPLCFAAAALAPLAVASAGRTRLLAGGMAGAWIALSATGVVTVPAAAYDTTPHADLEALVPYLEAHGLSRGYASFWDAGALTWASDFRLEVRPVMQGTPCGDPGGRSLCAYHFNSADGWFDPRPVQRSFLLVHPGAACISGAPDPASVAVVADVRVGGAELLLVDGDLAAHLVRSSFALCGLGDGEPPPPVR